MTVNPVAFYLFAALVVAGSLAAVGLPSPRPSALALAATLVAAAGLEALTGARMLAALQLLLVALAAGAATAMARGRDLSVLVRVAGGRGRRLAGAAAGLGMLGVLVWTFGTSSHAWHAGRASATLLSVLKHREPLVAGTAVVLLAAGIGGALLIGSVGRDELDFERRREERRQREERMRRRRDDRMAARRRRGSAVESDG